MLFAARPRESGDPERKEGKDWIPAFAGMSGNSYARFTSATANPAMRL